jgi:hypothetical protein
LAATIQCGERYFAAANILKEVRMKKTLTVLATVAALGATTMVAPAEAHGRHGWGGAGLAFGLAAGALTAGAIAASRPYYGPYYGPGYYGAGPYAYYGGPIYRRHYWHRHWHRW